MLSLSRNGRRVQRPLVSAHVPAGSSARVWSSLSTIAAVPASLSTIAAAVLAAPAALAAEFYYQPIVTLATAYNTNLDLDQGHRKGEGYFADAATTIGIATPTSDTTLQPRVLYNYYPAQTDRNRVEEFFNLNSTYRWQRDRFSINGFFDRRDDVNAEQPTAETNQINPGIGNTNPGTGHTLVGVTRNWLILDPTFTHALTPLSGIGVSGEYQHLSFSTQDTSHVDFNYYLGRVFYSWTATPRTDFDVSAFGARYLAGNINSNSTTGGVSGEMKYNWSQTLQSRLSASYEHVRFRETDPHPLNENTNAWAADFTTVYTGAASQYSASIGRSIAPSASGGLFRTDQVRGVYDRDFTQRLHFTTAVRFFRDHTIAGVGGDDTRNYLTSFVKLQWMMTPRIFIAGSYTYVYQKYRTSPNSADANVAWFGIGYRGLGRQ